VLKNTSIKRKEHAAAYSAKQESQEHGGEKLIPNMLPALIHFIFLHNSLIN
jgi:hypothetical protein